MSKPSELSPAQLRVMASRVRTEMIAWLARNGPQSARELAAHFGRPVTGFYHHIEQLERAGLVRVVEARPGRRRPEALYDLVSQRLSSRAAALSNSGRKALAKVARLFLAGAARSVSAALTSNIATTEGPKRDTSVRRVQVCLDDGALAQMNKDLDALLARVQAQSGAKGTAVELTIALAPSQRSSRK